MLGRRGRGALPNTASATTGLVGESMLARVLLGYTTFSSDILNKGASETAKASERRQKGRENSLEVAQRRSVFYDTGWRNDTLAIAEMNPNCVGNLAVGHNTHPGAAEKEKGKENERREGGSAETETGRAVFNYQTSRSPKLSHADGADVDDRPSESAEEESKVQEGR